MASDVLDLGPVIGPSGTKYFTAAANMASPPNGSRPEDYILNSTTGNLTIAGVTVAGGGIVQITTVNPFVVAGVGNIRGPGGPAGGAGPAGTALYSVTASTPNPPANIRYWDLLLHAGSVNISIGNQSNVAPGTLLRVTSVNPFTLVVTGNLRGVQGVPGTPGNDGPPGPPGQNGTNGVNGATGPRGASIYVIANNLPTPPAHVVVGDALVNGNPSGNSITVGGLTVPAGGVFSVQSTSPFQGYISGNVRGPQGVQGPAGNPSLVKRYLRTVRTQTNNVPGVTGSQYFNYFTAINSVQTIGDIIRSMLASNIKAPDNSVAASGTIPLNNAGTVQVECVDASTSNIYYYLRFGYLTNANSHASSPVVESDILLIGSGISLDLGVS